MTRGAENPICINIKYLIFHTCSHLFLRNQKQNYNKDAQFSYNYGTLFSKVMT